MELTFLRVPDSLKLEVITSSPQLRGEIMCIAESPDQDTADPGISDEENWRPPGLELQHNMHFVLQDSDAVAPLMEALRRAGAEIRTFALNRRAMTLASRCLVTGISSRRARDLISQLEQARLIEGPASVEHLMLAPDKR